MTTGLDLTHSLLRFAHVGLGYNRITVEEHGHILNLLEKFGNELIAGENKCQKIVQILLPRASYKTTIASVSFPMWLLQKDCNLRVMLDSETYNLSKSILSEIKQQYMYGPYTQNFEAVDPKNVMRWAEDSIILPWRTAPKKEGNFAAAGLDGVKAGMHYDLIIADDLHSQNNTRTRYQIEQVIEHYRLLLSILEPNGLLVVIGTRWAEDDAYTTISKDATAELFIPATSTVSMNINSELKETDDPLLVYDHIADSAVNATKFYLNFPKVLPFSHLSAIEKRQGPYIYSAQYLLKPVASKEKRFKEEWVKYYTECPGAPMFGETGYDPHIVRPLSSKFYRKVGLVDPAFTTQDYSDFTGICVIAADSQRNMYVNHADQYKLEPFELIEKIFHLHALYDVSEWYIEEVAAQRVLKFFLEYLMGKEDKRIFVGSVKSYGRKKEFRIMSLQPYCASGKLFVRPDQEVLLHQMRRFPILKNDDVLDALAYAPQVIFDGDTPSIITYKNEKITMGDLTQEIRDRNGSGGIRPWGYQGTSTKRNCFFV